MLHAMTLVEPILTTLGLGGGGVLIAFTSCVLPRIRRSYWWLVARHAVLARLLVVVPSMERDALVHGLKRALLGAVPPPVLRERRVPARLEVIVPTNAVGQLAAAGPGLTDDLAAWLTRLALRRGWTLPDRPGICITLTTDEYGIARRPRARAAMPSSRSRQPQRRTRR
jgi:hypothetical protein